MYLRFYMEHHYKKRHQKFFLFLFYDLKIFLQCDRDLRLKRRVHRDINQRGRSEKDVIDLFSKRLDSMHKKYVIPVKKYCDIIINTGKQVNYDDLIKKIKI